MRWIVAFLIAIGVTGCCSGLWRAIAGKNAGACLHVDGAPEGAVWGATLDLDGPDGFVDDLVAYGPDTPQHLGKFTESDRSNVAACFCRKRLPRIWRKGAWDAGGQDIRLGLEKARGIDLTVWIVQEPFGEVKQAAVDAITWAETVWAKERMGLHFAKVEWCNATENVNRDDFLDFDESEDGLIVKPENEGGIGFRPGRINVYYVKSVAIKPGTTASDGDDTVLEFHSGTAAGTADFVAIASQAGATLLVHEIGHCMLLDHPPSGDAKFDETNVMHAASSSRRFLTEGQIFRAHAYDESTVNLIYGIHPSDELIGLDPYVPHQDLPLDLRLFSDGEFAADVPQE